MKVSKYFDGVSTLKRRDLGDGNIYYYNSDNKLHRLDGPAIESRKRGKFFFIEGKDYSEKKFNLKILNLMKNKQFK